MERKPGKWSELRERVFSDAAARERYERKLNALVNERRRLLAALAPDDPVLSDDMTCDEQDWLGSDRP